MIGRLLFETRCRAREPETISRRIEAFAWALSWIGRSDVPRTSPSAKADHRTQRSVPSSVASSSRACAMAPAIPSVASPESAR